MAITYQPIASTTLSSASSSITFSSILSTWTDLRLVINIPSVSTPLYALMKFNNTSTDISFIQMRGNGSSAGTGRSTSDVAYLDYSDTLSTTLPTLSIVDIFSYAGSTHKPFLINSNYDKNGSGVVERFVGSFHSTSAITRIDVYTSTGTFGIGTIVSLYGIKKA